MQVPNLPLNHCHVAASAQQVHKCPPPKNETRPCIRLQFSRQNEFFRSSTESGNSGFVEL